MYESKINKDLMNIVKASRCEKCVGTCQGTCFGCSGTCDYVCASTCQSGPGMSAHAPDFE